MAKPIRRGRVDAAGALGWRVRMTECDGECEHGRSTGECEVTRDRVRHEMTEREAYAVLYAWLGGGDA